jgi:hypothetical protein
MDLIMSNHEIYLFICLQIIAEITADDSVVVLKNVTL